MEHPSYLPGIVPLMSPLLLQLPDAIKNKRDAGIVSN